MTVSAASIVPGWADGGDRFPRGPPEGLGLVPATVLLRSPCGRLTGSALRPGRHRRSLWPGPSRPVRRLQDASTPPGAKNADDGGRPDAGSISLSPGALPHPPESERVEAPAPGRRIAAEPAVTGAASRTGGSRSRVWRLRPMATGLPDPRSVQLAEMRQVEAIPQVGGLRHRYQRRAA